MLEHSRGSSGELRSFDLNDPFEEALNLAYHGARASTQASTLRWNAISPTQLPRSNWCPKTYSGLSHHVRQWLLRCDQAPEGGKRPKVQADPQDTTRDLGHAVEVVRATTALVFRPISRTSGFSQPFSATKPTEEGTSLGPSINYDIVTQEHGGAITRR